MPLPKSKIEEVPPAEMVLTTPSKEPSIKSNAVVKYSTVSSPVMYSQLRFNTDIKLPPRNWLTSSAASRGLNDTNFRSSGFSSFRMANMFPESVGEVDVVSDAENIKKLLKIPYSSKSVSMIVHRVENTLLIDDFDIHKHLLLRAEDDWAWMRQYFIEHILSTLSSKDRALPYHDKSRTTLQQKSLVSKFLHYSLAETDDKTENNEQRLKDVKSPLHIDTKGPALPDPQFEHGIPRSDEDHQFTRNVLWTFEDIQMLLGTDMPIFGGPLRPCISLRLRDANRPISVLTGIDYWLDNLMSNVPEVVMCYHLDGIVQKYELIKTEDLPNLNESRFSPELIRDVAQNILSFLKANATKAGHTYWLFKGTNEDAVKLYDLTSLCSESMRDKEQNPFTVPVGMLLYRVARNMMAMEATPGHNNTIRTVLKNCISLLSKEKHPQIVTSAHYMLAEVYIPFETDPSSPILLSQLEHELFSIDENEDPNHEDSTPVNTLLLKKPVASRKPESEKYAQSSIAKCGIEERCKCALVHVSEGLDCLQYFESNKKCEEGDDNHPKMANPNEAIPMHFSKPPEKGRKKKKSGTNKSEKAGQEDAFLKSLLCKPLAKAMPTWQRPEEMEQNTWKGYLFSLLTEKACLAYSILVEREIEADKYSLALKHIKNVLRCCGDDQILAGAMLSRAGDCLFNLLKSLLATGMETFQLQDELDDYPTLTFKTPTAFQSDIELLDPGSNIDELAETISNCFKRALELNPSNEIKSRTGNVCNVLSSLYTSKSKDLLEAEDFDKDAFNAYIKKSEQLLVFGVKIFEEVGDCVNNALLLSNWGRLYRLRAHAPSNINPVFSSLFQQQYSKAVDCYTNALFSLGSRKVAPDVWDIIYWELSTSLYTWATLNQNHPPAPSGSKSAEDIEREAVELLQKAAKFCDVNSQSFRQPLYQFRLAILHQRLGSLYFNSYRTNDFDDNKAKQIVQLCHINYSKAISLFSALDNPLQVLRVQLERLALFELVAEESKSPKTKIKNLLRALSVCSQCKSAVSQIRKKPNEPSTDEPVSEGDKEDEDLEEERLLQAFHERLNSILLTLIKLLSTTEKNTKSVPEYKQIYLASLKKDKNVPLVAHLEQTLGLLPKPES